MAHGIIGIDHLIVGVADLEATAHAWRRMGFSISPRGRHIGWGTGNYCVMFPDDYIELLGIVDRSQFTNGLDTLDEDRALSMVWATRDTAASVASLTATGIAIGEVKDLARQLELEEGSMLPRFKLAHFPDAEATMGVANFLCQHLTPAMIRRPAWLMHPNAAIALKGLTIYHPDPLSLVATYERLFGMASVNTTDNVVTLHAGRQRVIFANDDDLDVLHPEVDFFDIIEAAKPRIALATIASGDVEMTADYMASWQIEHEEQADGSIVIPPQAANGVALEFVRA